MQDIHSEPSGLANLTKLELFTLIALHAQAGKSLFTQASAGVFAFEAARAALDRCEHEQRGVKP